MREDGSRSAVWSYGFRPGPGGPRKSYGRWIHGRSLTRGSRFPPSLATTFVGVDFRVATTANRHPAHPVEGSPLSAPAPSRRVERAGLSNPLIHPPRFAPVTRRPIRPRPVITAESRSPRRRFRPRRSAALDRRFTAGKTPTCGSSPRHTHPPRAGVIFNQREHCPAAGPRGFQTRARLCAAITRSAHHKLDICLRISFHQAPGQSATGLLAQVTAQVFSRLSRRGRPSPVERATALVKAAGGTAKCHPRPSQPVLDLPVRGRHMQPGNGSSDSAARDRAFWFDPLCPFGMDHLALDPGGRAGPPRRRRRATMSRAY